MCEERATSWAVKWEVEKKYNIEIPLSSLSLSSQKKKSKVILEMMMTFFFRAHNVEPRASWRTHRFCFFCFVQLYFGGVRWFFISQCDFAIFSSLVRRIFLLLSLTSRKLDRCENFALVNVKSVKYLGQSTADSSESFTNSSSSFIEFQTHQVSWKTQYKSFEIGHHVLLWHSYT